MEVSKKLFLIIFSILIFFEFAVSNSKFTPKKLKKLLRISLKLSEDFLKSDLNSLLENLKSNPKKIVKLDNFLQKNRIVFLNSEEDSYKNFLKQIRNKIINLYPKGFEDEITEKKVLELCEIEAFRLNIKIQSITREVKVPEFLNSLEIRTLGAFTLEGFKEDFINSDTLALDIYDNFAGQFYLKSMETFYKRDSIEFKTLVELNNKKLLCSNSSFFLNFLVNLKLYKN